VQSKWFMVSTGSKLSASHERQDRSDAAGMFMASLVESCDEAIIGTTLEGRVLSWNSAAEHLFGYTAAEIVGRSYTLLDPPYRPENLAEMLPGIRDGNHVEPCETVHFRKNGAKVEVLLRVSPVTNQGRVIGASIVAHDITQRKLEESERLTLIQELTAALARSLNLTTEHTGKH
jgi:PAS domain S-box-containing protein